MPSKQIQPGCWVAKFTSRERPEIGRVKYVRPSPHGRNGNELMDVVLYNLKGERLCKGVPPIGESESYARNVDVDGWEVIAKPDFEMLELAMTRGMQVAMLRMRPTAVF
jgi:hypothetical protein